MTAPTTPDWLINLREQWRQDDIKRRLKAAFRRVKRPAKPRRDRDAS